MLENLNADFSDLLIKDNLLANLANDLVDISFAYLLRWNFFNKGLYFSIYFLHNKRACLHIILHFDLKCLWFIFFYYLEFSEIKSSKIKDSFVEINLFEIRNNPLFFIRWLNQLHSPFDSIFTLTGDFTEGVEIYWLSYS